jgi:hypothetical protein
MSSKTMAVCSFEPAAGQTVAIDHRAPAGCAARIQFREDLWREYQLEAINTGFSTAQATEYASALSPEMGLAVGASEMAPVGRGWFYQSRIRVVKRTIASGLIGFTRREGSRTIGVPKFAFGFRPWNGGGRT